MLADCAPLDAVDARVLLRHALQVDDAYLIAHRDEALTAEQAAAFVSLRARRAAGEPVAYIVGAREFFSLEFKVTPAVLIPRPETELLVEVALERIPENRAARALDLGTGSGCIAIALAKQRPHAEIAAVDRSAAALEVARHNARRHAVSNVEFKSGDWFTALDPQRFDVIVSNPPYIAADDPHLAAGDVRAEPASALVGGADGFDCIRAIVAGAPRHLNPGGLLALEHGYDQAERVRALLAAAGFTDVFSREDLAGIARVSGGMWTQS